MPCCHISDDTKRAIVNLRRTESQSRVAALLGVSLSTVKRVDRNVKENGHVSRPAICPGRKRLLGNREATFLQGCIERQPDMTAEELQDELEAMFGIRASPQTISRTLQRRGYTRKEVCMPLLLRFC
ncbi:hypothetical protein EXIGLDRAFT_607723 [Exidia glandulosa HHB12029]|uniref:Transposase Tc1-like domain-containing protein n=1 Tax=Exidia glandulosa HHB12029 TaxID=1314781 RepID=A0A165LDS9_EXIGL|nr:hypothetical protein EXIGLDRAFT_607723 [Exidia glandulosa HHB12029]